MESYYLMPIILSRPRTYNKTKMKTHIQLATVALFFALLVVITCETIDSSIPNPSERDVASIAEGPDLASLGIGTTPLGSIVTASTSNNSRTSVSLDDSPLKDLSDMINQLLASLKSAPSTSNKSDKTEKK